ncbi:MAG: hypothetical protein ACI841_002864 [Planctomycetota bacterium]|jgi:hypothetical protein
MRAGELRSGIDISQFTGALGSVLQLEEPFRSTLLLRFFEQLEPRKIAQRLQVPAPTVRSRITLGLEKMRAALPAEDRMERSLKFNGFACLLALMGLGRKWSLNARALGLGLATLVVFTAALPFWLSSQSSQADPVLAELAQASQTVIHSSFGALAAPVADRSGKAVKRVSAPIADASTVFGDAKSPDGLPFAKALVSPVLDLPRAVSD